MIPFFELDAMHGPLTRELEEVLAGALASSRFVGGPQVEGFESAFANYCDAAHAVGVSNGTDALMLALRAVGVGPGDEVVLPAITFAATAEAVVMAGARPVLADVDPDDGLMDRMDARARVTERTKAVVPVHLYGNPLDVASLREVLPPDVAIIEDAAQAHGARSGHRRVGTLGAAGCFSFYPSKNLGALGDAGAVVTDSDEVAAHVRRLRDHGQAAKYEHESFGVNARLDALQAGFLIRKLPHLDGWNQQRREIAGWYDEMLGDVEGVRPLARSEESVVHLYVIRCSKRDDLQKHLSTRGIGTGIHYPKALHTLQAFEGSAGGPGAFPHAERLASEVLSLPMFPGLSRGQVEEVVETISEFVRGDR